MSGMDRLDVDLVLEAITLGFGQVVKELEGINTAVNKTGQETTKTSEQVEGTGTKLTMLGRVAQKTGMVFTEMHAQLQLATFGFQQVRRVADEFYSSLKEGAELELANARFEKLTASMGRSADTMRKDLREATNGMFSDAKMVASANDIMRLKLADTADGVVDLAEVVTKLGWDMQQVVLTFANNSKMRLDALGLSVEDVNAKTKAFIAQGYNMDKAFDLAVIQAGREQIALLGDAADSTAGKLQRFEAAGANISDRLKLVLVDRWAPIIGGLADYADTVQAAQQDLTDAVRLGIITQEEAETIMRMSMHGYDEWQAKLRAVREEVEGLRPELERLAALQEALDYAARNSTDTYEDIVAMQEQATKARQMETWALQRQEEEQRKAEEATSGGAQAFRDARQAVLDYSEALKESRTNLALTREEQERLASAAGDAFTAALRAGEDALVSWKTTVVATGGLTGDQRKNLSELSDEYERIQDNIRSLQGGSAGLGLSTDQLNDKLAKEYARLEEVGAAMQPLAGMTATITSVNEGFAYNMDAIIAGMYDQADAAGADAAELARMALAAGQAEEDVVAAFKGMLIQAEQVKLGEAIANGLDPEIAVNRMESFIAGLEARDFRMLLGIDVEEGADTKARDKISEVIAKGIPEDDRKIKIGLDLDDAWDKATTFTGDLAASLQDPYVAVVGADVSVAETEVARLMSDVLDPYVKGTYAAVIDADTAHGLAAVDGIKEAIANIKGRIVYVDVISRYSEEGTPPKGGGGAADNPDAGAATGLESFVVPHGYPNDKFRLGLTSGEIVTVRTPAQASQQAASAAAGDTFIFNNNTREAAALAAAQVDQLRRAKLNAFMGG